MTNQIKKNETIIKNFEELDKLLSLFKSNEILTSELNVIANLTKLENFVYQIYNKPLIIETKNEKLKKEVLSKHTIIVKNAARILELLEEFNDLMNEFVIKTCGSRDYLITHFEENFNFSDKISTIDNIKELEYFLEDFFNSSTLFDYKDEMREDAECMFSIICCIHDLMLKVITLINKLRNLKDQK